MAQIETTNPPNEYPDIVGAKPASTDKIDGKIQRAEQMKVHTIFVIGKRDMDADAVSVRVHGQGNLSAQPRVEVISDILQSIKERRA
jgi:threonyl-tRNA synthetase